MSDEIKKSIRDGEVWVRRMPILTQGNVTVEAAIVLHADDTGVNGGQTIICSEFNARRLLAALSMVLKLPLSPKAKSQIKL